MSLEPRDEGRKSAKRTGDANARKNSRNTIRAIAADCLAKADGEWTVAAAMMEKRVENNAKLFKELMSPLLKQAIWDQIRYATRIERRDIIEASRVHHSENTDDIDAMNTVREADWLAYLLPGGIKLGDADAQTLMEVASMHESYAASNQKKAKWMTMIAMELEQKNARRVRDVFDNEAVGNLWETCTNAR